MPPPPLDTMNTPTSTMKTKSKCAKCGQTGHFSTHHFKEENNPNLAAMRTEWRRKFEELMERIVTTKKGTPEWEAVGAEAEDHLKTQKTLWSKRELFSLDAK